MINISFLRKEGKLIVKDVREKKFFTVYYPPINTNEIKSIINRHEVEIQTDNIRLSPSELSRYKV